ncbi:hypothetical protein ZWY2020_019694 [Hordeum vulgare]|nr:hypothetical protein ZWY2020_019694 [Hordeum vulgare]
MQPEHVHRVDKLNPEVAWSFLQKMVASGDRDDHQFCKLREIGMEIVKKCDCSPLAIKTVAEDLKKRNKTRSAWLDELNNQKWSEKGLPAELYESIYISFDDLPPHLKQCFLYCCLFYEDEVINYDKAHWVEFLDPTSTLVSDSDEEMDSLIGRHFASIATSTIVFPKLRKLVFYGMLQWKEWDWDAQLEAMHALKSTNQQMQIEPSTSWPCNPDD